MNRSPTQSEVSKSTTKKSKVKTEVDNYKGQDNYRILMQRNPKDLSVLVNKYKKEGWSCAGGPLVIYDHEEKMWAYIQAVEL